MHYKFKPFACSTNIFPVSQSKHYLDKQKLLTVIRVHVYIPGLVSVFPSPTPRNMMLALCYILKGFYHYI